MKGPEFMTGRYLVIGLAILAVSGCSTKSGKISGQVTKNGEAAANLVVIFHTESKGPLSAPLMKTAPTRSKICPLKQSAFP